jgi:hypothetical protein
VRRVLAVLFLCLLVGEAFHFPVFEDAFITFRCADNFAEGHGLNYNPDARVESSTAFFFALLLGLAQRLLRFEPLGCSHLLNLAAFAFILFALAAHTRRRIEAAGPRPLAWAGFWWAALQPALWVYVHSGLETVFFAALLFGGFLATVACIERRGPAWPVGVALGVAALVRMEAGVFAALATTLVFALGPRERRWRNAGLAGGLFAAIFAPVLAGRWHYYGYPFPISYYVKLDGGSPALAARGAMYVLTWLAVCPVAAATIVGALLLSRRAAETRNAGVAPAFSTSRQACPGPRSGAGGGPASRPRLRLGLIWLAVQLALVAYLGGDYMPYARFLVPAIPVVAWLLAEVAPTWLQRADERRPASATRRKRLAVAALAVSLAGTFFFPLDFMLFLQEGAYLAAYRPAAKALHRLIPDRHVTLFTLAAGVVPYYSKLQTYDGLGIADPVIAHRRAELGRGLAGHEKFDAQRILALQPDIILCQVFPKDIPFRSLPYIRDDPQTGEQVLIDPLGGTHDVSGLKSQPAFYAFAHDLEALLDLYHDPAFLSQYALLRLRDRSSLALFFVRKNSAARVRIAFMPIDLYFRDFGKDGGPAQNRD